jgi:hypothetical protein
VIHDQYTDRKDLSTHQKWRLRNLEKAKRYPRSWNFAHADRVADAVKAFRKRKAEKKAKVAHDNTQSFLQKGINLQSARAKGIIRLHLDGYGQADICIHTAIRMSVVSATIEAFKASNQSTTP